MNQGQYKTKGIRILAAFIGSCYIVLYGRTSEIWTALISPRFYLAFAVSFAVALFIVSIVHHSWIWLDIRYSWTEKTLKRIGLQIALGLALPLTVDLLCMTLYFGVIGQSILDNGFLDFDFLYVGCLVVALNIYYGFYHYYLSLQNPTEEQNLVEKTPPEKNSCIEHPDILVIFHKGIHANLKLPEIFCFYRYGKKVNKNITEEGSLSTPVREGE